MMYTPQNEREQPTVVDKDISEFKHLDWVINSIRFDTDRDSSEIGEYIDSKQWVAERIAENVINNPEYALEFNSKANEDIKNEIYEQDLISLKHGRFYDPKAWFNGIKEMVNNDLESLDKGIATYKELAIDEKRKDPKYAKAMDEYINSYNAGVSFEDKFDLNSYKNTDIQKDKQVIRNEIETLVIKRNSQNPAYREQFMLAQKDLALYRKGDISTDEMRLKSQNSLYHTAFEDNLRLQAYSNPQFSLQQAEAHIAKFSIESLRDRSKEQVINPAEKDLIRWDNQKITPLELGKKLQSPEYKTAFEKALREQYKPGLEGYFGCSFSGTDKEKSAQFAAMRITNIENIIRTAEKYNVRVAEIGNFIRAAEKYKEMRANMGRGVDKGLEKDQTRDFER